MRRILCILFIVTATLPTASAQSASDVVGLLGSRLPRDARATVRAVEELADDVESQTASSSDDMYGRWVEAQTAMDTLPRDVADHPRVVRARETMVALRDTIPGPAEEVAPLHKEPTEPSTPTIEAPQRAPTVYAPQAAPTVYPEQPFPHPYLDAHVGEVVFLSDRVSLSDFNPSDSVNRVALGEPFYSRAILPVSYGNAIRALPELSGVGDDTLEGNNHGGVIVDTWTLNGGPECDVVTQTGHPSWKTSIITLTAPQDVRNRPKSERLFLECMARFAPYLTAGEHSLTRTVRVGFNAGGGERVVGEPLATGQIRLSVARNAYRPSHPVLCLGESNTPEWDEDLAETYRRAFPQTQMLGIVGGARLTDASFDQLEYVQGHVMVRSQDGDCSITKWNFQPQYLDNSLAGFALDEQVRGPVRKVGCGCVDGLPSAAQPWEPPPKRWTAQ